MTRDCTNINCYYIGNSFNNLIYFLLQYIEGGGFKNKNRSLTFNSKSFYVSIP